MKRVFLLGAGFSRQAGFPLAFGLLDFIGKYLRGSSNILDIEFRNEFMSFIEETDVSDVELLLTHIDLAILNNSANLYKGYDEIDDLRLFRKKLSGTLVRAFDCVHCSLDNNDQKREIYRKFCEQIGNGDTVITFNYDVLVEQILWEQNKWTFLDGYGIKKNVNDFQDPPWGGLYPKDKPQESSVKVYKLHGSLGWLYDDIKEEVYYCRMPNFFQECNTSFCEGGVKNQTLGASYDEATTLIEPTYMKNFDKSYIIDIWNQSYNAIQQSDELIIIGYSLPEPDSVAQMFLSLAVTNASIKTITVVNPDGVVFERFERTFKRPVVRKKIRLDEWLQMDAI